MILIGDGMTNDGDDKETNQILSICTFILDVSVIMIYNYFVNLYLHYLFFKERLLKGSDMRT